MALPRYLTPLLMARLAQIAEAVSRGTTREQCEQVMGISEVQMASTMFRLFGASTWPPVIDARLWTLPVQDPPPPTTGGRRKVEIVKDDQAIAERVARDQARIREQRERWLEIEQKKYGLPRRARSIDDMPA
jgi:hypothetical protein